MGLKKQQILLQQILPDGAKETVNHYYLMRLKKQQILPDGAKETANTT